MPLNMACAFSMLRARLMPPVAASVVTPAVTVPIAVEMDLPTLPKLEAKKPATCEPTDLAVSLRLLSLEADLSRPLSMLEPS